MFFETLLPIVIVGMLALSRLPRAFVGLLATLIWIYLEMLRLLSKLRGRK